MSLTGNLKDYSFPRLLIDLSRKRATGSIVITTPKFTKKVYLNNGSAIFASSTLEDERLGEMLIKAGKISIEQYEKSVHLLKSTGDRQGAILVELGYITPKDLFWGVKYQVKEIIYSLFLLEEGTYEFRDEALPADEVITLKISMENLVYEGIKRTDNLTRIRREMPDTNAVFKRNEDPTNAFRGINLNEQDKTVLSLVDGWRTIKQIIEESRQNSFDVMKTLHILLLTGFIIGKETMEHAGETISVDEILESISEDENKLIKRVEDLYKQLDRIGQAEILQIDENADSETVKRKYYRLAKEFHPDRIYNSRNKDLQNKLVVVFDAITKAYNSLKDESKRREYFESLSKPVKHKEDTKSALIEEQFGRGIEEFKKGDYWGASEIFRWITKEDPKIPKAWSYLSLSLSKMPQKLKDAEEALLEAIKLEPFNSDHYANLGLIYTKAGLNKRAQSQFERALRLDPENAKAQKGLEQVKEQPS